MLLLMHAYYYLLSETKSGNHLDKASRPTVMQLQMLMTSFSVDCVIGKTGSAICDDALGPS